MSRSRHKHSPWKQWSKAHLPKLLLVLAGVAVAGGGVYVATRKSPEDHLRAGLELQKSGDLKGAEIELKNALQGQPDNADARFKLGQIHFKNGDYPSAVKELGKARALGLRDDALELLYARALLNLREAKRLLDEVPPVETAPAETRAAVLALRARAHLLLRDPNASEKTLAEADAIQADHPETLVSRAYLALSDNKADSLTPIDQPMTDTPRRAAEALALVDKALAKAPDRTDILLLKADLLLATKQKQTALQAYSQALDKEPANANALRARAQVHLEMSDLDKAERDLKALFKQLPRDVYGRYLQAYVEFKRSRFQEANNILQDILKSAPNFLSAHLLAGAVNIELGNREAARNHLEKVLAAAPQQPLAKKLMAATMAEMGDLGKARELVSSLSGADADSLTHSVRGVIALRQGDYAEARKNLEQVSGTATTNIHYLTDLAASRLGTGDEKGAIDALNKAAELDKDSSRPEVLLVMTHLRDKQPGEAMKVVDKLEKEHPQDPLASNLRGAIHISQNDMPKARAAFSRALELKPDYFPAASNLALLDVRDKALDAARGRFQTLLKHNPREYRAWMALAAFDQQAGNESAYLNDLEQAKKANEKAPQPRIQLVRYWLGKNDPGKALVESRSALDATGQGNFNEYIGLSLAAQGDHTNAIATFTKWAETNPKNPVAFFRLAQSQAAMKDIGAALKSLDKALSLRPDFLDASVSKALLLGQSGRGAEGIKIARDIQVKAPRSAAGFLAEAEILASGGKFAEAAKLFAKGAQMSGGSPAIVRAALAYARAGQPAEGEKLLDQWLRTKPNDHQARHQLALSYLNGKRLREAADQYRILVRANPKDLVAYNNLAWALGELRDKEALTVAEQAYKLNPGHPTTQDTLGWILVNQGQVSKGIDLLNKAHAKAPAAAEIHWHYAYALAKSGDRKRAKEELEKLIYSGQPFPQKDEATTLFNSL